jgi:hypothetical protein
VGALLSLLILSHGVSIGPEVGSISLTVSGSLFSVSHNESMAMLSCFDTSINFVLYYCQLILTRVLMFFLKGNTVGAVFGKRTGVITNQNATLKVIDSDFIGTKNEAQFVSTPIGHIV